MVCPNCGTVIGQPELQKEPKPNQKKPSWQAYATFYLGLLSVVFWCLFFIPFILGIYELLSIRKKKSSNLSIGYSIAGLIFSCIGLYFFILNPVLGFFNAQVRSKVSRAKGEMQMIASGLEAYYSDNKTYPLPDYDAKGTPFVPHVLTTPIAYITALPHDPFSQQGYRYFAGREDEPRKTYWFLESNGPDKKIDYNVANYSPIDPFWRDLNGALITFDPSNGTVSAGDIWRRGP